MLAVAVLLAGWRSGAGTSSAAIPDLDAEIARASPLRQPILVLVAESGQSRADDRARALFDKFALTGKGGSIAYVLVDISISRNRALAARFHVTNTPLLVGLSPMGLIITRDEMPLTKELLRSQVNVLLQQAPALDAKLASLAGAAARDGNNAAAQLTLADFLLSRNNAREAIPHLAAVARSESAEPRERIEAWVKLGRAHLWIAETEKARNEAKDLIALMGPQFAEARAGGNLVLGLHATFQKRPAVARQYFQAAIAAAPDSEYAKQAAEALAKLDGEAR
jgi:tetratricopeptide (TPR) repeat protein